MSKQTIGVGTVVNDGAGDNLRAAGIKINDNFTELYNALSDDGTSANKVVYQAVQQTVTGQKSFESNKTIIGYTKTSDKNKYYDGLGGQDARVEVTANDSTSNVTIEYKGSLKAGATSAENSPTGVAIPSTSGNSTSGLNSFDGNPAFNIGVGQLSTGGLDELRHNGGFPFNLYNKTNDISLISASDILFQAGHVFQDSDGDGIVDNFSDSGVSISRSDISIDGSATTGRVQINSLDATFDTTADFKELVNMSRAPTIDDSDRSSMPNGELLFKSGKPNGSNPAAGSASFINPRIKLFHTNEGRSLNPTSDGRSGVADENVGALLFHGHNNRKITGTITTGQEFFTNELVTPLGNADGKNRLYDSTKSWTSLKVENLGDEAGSVQVGDTITITSGSHIGAVAKVGFIISSGTQEQNHLNIDNDGFLLSGVRVYPSVGDSYSVSAPSEVFYGQINVGIKDPAHNAQKGQIDFYAADGSASSSAGHSFFDINNDGSVIFPKGPSLRISSEEIRVADDNVFSIGIDSDIQIKHNSTSNANTIGTSGDTDLLQLSDNKVKINGLSQLVFDETGSIRFNNGTSDSSTEFFRMTKDSNGDVVFDDVVDSDNESAHEFFINTNRFRLRHTTDESTYTNMLSFDAETAVTISNALTVTKDTGISVTGNLTASGSVIGGVDTVSGDGSGTDAISLNTDVTFLNTSGGTSNLTLATGTDGQVKRIIMEVFTGAATLTVSNGNLISGQVVFDTDGSAGGDTTQDLDDSITFDAVGESVTLVYSASLSKWIVTQILGATVT